MAELGRGGMGNVYLAVVSGPGGFKKLHVVKRLRPELAMDVDSVTMFLDEARLAARLSHPNVVQTNEAGQEAGHYFIAMEYLEGQSLDHLVRRARDAQVRIPLAIHLRILCGTLAGLHHAHELQDFRGTPLGLVHRDVTPQNIFVTYDGVAKLLDFGIAKAATSNHRTQTGTFKGKCAYMPPEQIVGDPIDRRADIFSVGAVLWSSLTGERLWKGESELRIFTRVINGDIPSPRTVNPAIPDALEAICMRALAPQRDDRYSTAQEMQSALEHYIEEHALRASDREIGRFLTQLFAEERARMKVAIDTQLRALARTSQSNPPSLLSSLGTESDQTAEGSSRQRFGSGPHEASAHGSLKAVVAAPPAHASSPPPSPLRARIFMLGFALVAGLGTYTLGRMQADPPASRSAGSPAKASVSTASTASNAPASPPAVVTPAPEASTSTVRVGASPASARLYLDELPLENNPFERAFPRDGAPHVIRAEAPGYKSQTQLVTFDGKPIDVNIDLALDPTIILRSSR